MVVPWFIGLEAQSSLSVGLTIMPRIIVLNHDHGSVSWYEGFISELLYVGFISSRQNHCTVKQYNNNHGLAHCILL